MTAGGSRDDVSRALKSIDRARKAVRGAHRASQIAEAAERAASAAAVAQQHMSVKADAETYKDTGKIVLLDDDDLQWCDEGEVVALTVEADTLAQVMNEAADRLESQARSWNRKVHEFEVLVSQQGDQNKKLQEEYDNISKIAQEGEIYLDMLPHHEATVAHLQDLRDLDEAEDSLELGDEEMAELQEEEAELRQKAEEAQDEAARKRHAAEKARAAAQARHRLVAIREVESEARRTADAAVAKARKRVMAAALAYGEDVLSKDRAAELLERFAGLVGEHQSLRNTP